MIPRIQQARIQEQIQGNKIVFIQGPRKVGKRELIEAIFEELNASYSFWDCTNKKTTKIVEGGWEAMKIATPYVVLYEGQYISNFGTLLEEVLDGKVNATVVVICSFVPDVHPDLMEALRMGGLVMDVYAPSFYESAQHFGLPQEERLLEERLIFGNYPAVSEDLPMAEVTLRELIQEVVFTRLSGSERINKGDKLMRMLQILAFEIGNTISYNELAERCGLDNETAERYIQLLEDAFLLYRLPSYSTGQRYELKKSQVIYFADNGIRNALISNFNPSFLRNDLEALWKNYVIAERIKWLRMHQSTTQLYFWQTHTQQRMDLIEISDSGMRAYKTSTTHIADERRKKVKIPQSFKDAYPTAKTSELNRSTYWSVLSQKKKV